MLYLVKQNKTYHLRIKVPLDFIRIVGRHEMRFTLKESQKRLAIKKVNAIKRRVGIYLKESGLTNWRFSVCWQMVSMIEELTGRAGKTETRKRYAKGYRVQTLYEECILKLDYELDLSGLRVSDLISE